MNRSRIYIWISGFIFTTVILLRAFPVNKSYGQLLPFHLSKVDSLQYSIDKYSRQIQSLDSCQRRYDTQKTKVKDIQERLAGLKHDKEEVCRRNDELINDLLGNSANNGEVDSLKTLITKNFDIQDRISEDINSEMLTLAKADSILKRTTNALFVSKKRCTEEFGAVHKFAQQVKESRRIKVNGVEYILFVADLERHDVELHLKDTSGHNYGNIGSLIKSMKRNGKEPLMITNGGMFMPDDNPQGLYIESGAGKLYDPDLTSPVTDGNFYLKPNGIFFIDSTNKGYVMKTEAFMTKVNDQYKGIRIATQSGPMLVVDGRLHPAFRYGSSNTRIRSGVGAINNKKIIFVASLDDVNFYDFALVFKDIFQCKNALYLDGAISLMYLNDKHKDEKGGHFGPMISVTKRK